MCCLKDFSDSKLHTELINLPMATLCGSCLIVLKSGIGRFEKLLLCFAHKVKKCILSNLK